jgi:hypothetical protein
MSTLSPSLSCGNFNFVFQDPVFGIRVKVGVAVQGSDGERKSEKSSKKRKHGSKEDRKGKSKYRDEKRKHGVKERKSKHKYSDDDEEEKEKEYSSDETSDDSGTSGCLKPWQYVAR